MESNTQKFLKEAIDLSREGMLSGKGGPFGCVIVKEGEIIGRGYNQVLALRDPTAHAEIMAIRDACQRLNSFSLEDCELYTSCEPCPMCMAAIYWARIPKVYFCNSKEDAAHIGFDDSFINNQLQLDPDQRFVLLRQIQSDFALQVFRDWENKTDKKMY